MSDTPNNDWTTIQVAEYLDVHPSYIRNEIRAGRLEAQKRGRDWFISRAAFETWNSKRVIRHKKDKQQE